MEIIARVSKGSRMDQVYIPKNRQGIAIGSYVLITPIEKPVTSEKPYFYNVGSIEPIKLRLIEEIFSAIGKMAEAYDNMIITGSFLDNGFCFNDIDILLVSSKKADIAGISRRIEHIAGVKPHIILLDNKTLVSGLSTDPLYQLMLSKCISKKRLIFRVTPKVSYKLLDLHLLKSRVLIDNFEILSGSEKYYLTRNMVAILLYLRLNRVGKEAVDMEITRLFNLDNVARIKENAINKDDFIRRYKAVYGKTFKLIMESIK